MIDPGEKVRTLIAQETRSVYDAHHEYLWYDPTQYSIDIYSWHNVEQDLIDTLIEKVSAILYDIETFTLYGHQYAVRISSRIDIQLEFQHDQHHRRIVRTLTDTFASSAGTLPPPFIPVARYKVPSKQQYSHLKNTLAKIETSVEVPVTSLLMAKVTEFGHGVRRYEMIRDIALADVP